jgi:hypothetical protein
VNPNRQADNWFMKVSRIAATAFVVLSLSACVAQPTTSEAPANPEPSQLAFGKMLPTPFAPEISPSFENPWPTDVSRIELVNTALFKAFEYFEEIKKSDCQISPITFGGEPMPPDHVQILEDIAEKMTAVFCKYLYDDFYVLGGNYKFIKKTIKAENIPGDFDKGCGQTGNLPFSACAFDQIASITNIGDKRKGQTFIEDRKLTIAAHEVFHVIHDQIDPDPGGQVPPRGQEFFRPVWFIEGGGEFFGRLMPYYFGLIDHYGTFAPSTRYGEPVKKDLLGDLELLEVRRQVADGTENYYSGQIALEYITASIGMKSLLEIWVKMGDGQSFDSALEVVTGLNTKQFYAKFKTLHDNLYEGDVVTNELSE